MFQENSTPACLTDLNSGSVSCGALSFIMSTINLDQADLILKEVSLSLTCLKGLEFQEILAQKQNYLSQSSELFCPSAI